MSGFLLWGVGALLMLMAGGSAEMGGEHPESRTTYRWFSITMMVLAALMWRAA